MLSFTLLILSSLSRPAVAAQWPILAAEQEPQERIDSAVSIYMAGDLSGARAELIRLVNDPALSEEELQLARILLGEVEYVGGEKEAARNTFRTVLLYDPNYRMDPFRHPPEVVSFFEATRAELSPRESPPTLTTQSTSPATEAGLVPAWGHAAQQRQATPWRQHIRWSRRLSWQHRAHSFLADLPGPRPNNLGH